MYVEQKFSALANTRNIIRIPVCTIIFMAAARNTSSLTQIEVVFTESLLAAFGSVKVIYTILLSIKIVPFLFDIICLQFYLTNENHSMFN